MSEYDKEPLSRAEEILDETSSGTGYDKEPLSRVEFRLKEVMAKIDGLVPDATVYKSAGSVTFANLPSPSKSTLGYVYDVSDAFTTTSDFKEGSGKKYPAGTNVAIVDIGTDENPIYKYDVLSGFIDMDNYVEKETGKGLSSNDFTDAAKNKLDDLENYDDTEIKNDISDLSDAVEDKVDKVAGKGLSTNDFTDAAKNKLAGLVNYDDTEIKNDISELETGKVDKVNGKSLSTNDYTDADKALVQDSPITVTATASPISTANGKPRAITIYGKSEIIDGVITSAGEGYAVVDLGTLNWQYTNPFGGEKYFFLSTTVTDAKQPTSTTMAVPMLTPAYTVADANYMFYNYSTEDKKITFYNNWLIIDNKDYTDPAQFKTAMSGVILAYELADHTQGNCIAVKTDNGTGIDATMATFSTGTPLRGIPDTTVRDVMEWDGSSGEVTKKCNKVRLTDLTWQWWDKHPNIIYADVVDKQVGLCDMMCSTYPYRQDIGFSFSNESAYPDKTIYCSMNITTIFIKNTDYSTKEDFVASLGDAELVYELASPTTTPLTQTENDSLSALKTYSPQTTITINDSPEFEVETYANTANGQAISDMQPTRSPLLTLSASGWTNNAQTVSYEHDTGKRNTIDVELASIKAWTAAGILATAETVTSITFECDTTPTVDLSFRVTSMEVR